MLDQLKILELTYIELGSSDELSGLLCLLASSPKLWKLSIGTCYARCEEEFDFQSNAEFYKDLKFESLQFYAEFYKDPKFESLCTVEFELLGTANVIEIIHLLLGCSPNLEVIFIKYPSARIVNALKEVNTLAIASPKARVIFV